MSGDPPEFILGGYWTNGGSSILPGDPSDVSAGNRLEVTNFTQDQNVSMTFSHTVSTSVEDHIVMAWVAGSNKFLAHSRWFAVNVSSTTNTETGGGITPSPTGSSVSVSQSSASTAISKYATATVAPTKSAPRVGAIVGGVLGSLAFLSVSGLILFMPCRRQTSRSSLLFRVFWKGLNENRRPITPFPLEPNRTNFHQERETETQVPVPEVSIGRDNLQAEMSRIREEILTLRLENQTRREEDRYGTLPPPSYTSSPSEPSSNI
ncbi:hypothetical protein IW261DRAFT_1568324 [Armillaria novae-zelandiae]|uniref:Uncharacterized protein n=1 Tax=Armillaria novae-zelandiae TaxID=153914 RepID=A0AA39P041_9AGAR|nr:hypothetical protein IW261DRAFT_1568324 [Armillaria novae-zelandiae]